MKNEGAKANTNIVLLLNSISPLIYLILLILFRYRYLSLQQDDFIEQNGIFLWVFQLLVVIVSFFLTQRRLLRILSVLLFFAFIVLIALTFDRFNVFRG